nr:MAG TPA: hypothetical protein [Caudoviricetes sp.]
MNFCSILGGGGNFGEYTHIVGVGTFVSSGNTFIGFSNGANNVQATGTLNPSSVENYFINHLYSSTVTTPIISVLGLNDPPAEQLNLDLYLGREDYNIAEKFTYIALMRIIEVSLFLENDIGKDVPIWLATTPPPLVSRLKRATVTSLKESQHEDTIRDATAKQLSDFNCRVLRKCLVAYWTFSVPLRSRYGRAVNTDKQRTTAGRSRTWSKALHKSNSEFNRDSRSSIWGILYRKFNRCDLYKYSQLRGFKPRVLHDRTKRFVHLHLYVATNCDLFKEVATC